MVMFSYRERICNHATADAVVSQFGRLSRRHIRTNETNAPLKAIVKMKRIQTARPSSVCVTTLANHARPSKATTKVAAPTSVEVAKTARGFLAATMRVCHRSAANLKLRPYPAAAREQL